MALQAFAYVSEVVQGIGGPDIDRILAAAATHNRVAGVTGVLMFDGRRFLQYLEGPDDGMALVQLRIQNSPSHTRIRVLARGPVATRQFPRWTIASTRIEPEVLTRIVDADWSGFAAVAPEQGQHRTGFARLLELWTGVSGELEPAAVTLGS